MKSIRKAVFPVAGFGTHYLPATRAIPKKLLPIVDKPLIQCPVGEAIMAGIDTLIFVTGRNKRAIEDHFDANNELESTLSARDKGTHADLVRNIIPYGVKCIFVRQAEQLGLGHAVSCAERVVDDGPFAVWLADDLITDYEPVMTGDQEKAFATSGKSQLSVMEVDWPDISKYRVVVPNDIGADTEGLVEKPDAKAVPFKLASLGRYVLTPDIFETLRGLSAGSDGEIQLADAINVRAQQGSVEAVFLNGQRFDGGSVEGFTRAFNHEYEKRL